MWYTRGDARKALDFPIVSQASLNTIVAKSGARGQTV